MTRPIEERMNMDEFVGLATKKAYAVVLKYGVSFQTATRWIAASRKFQGIAAPRRRADRPNKKKGTTKGYSVLRQHDESM